LQVSLLLLSVFHYHTPGSEQTSEKKNSDIHEMNPYSNGEKNNSTIKIWNKGPVPSTQKMKKKKGGSVVLLLFL